MKKNFTLAVISLIIISSANAQISYGVQAGVNIANWQGDALNSLNKVVDLTNGFISTKNRTGFNIGGYASIPLSDVQKLRESLERSTPAWKVNVYPGAGHAFFNDTRPSFHAEAAADAGTETLRFFKKHLQGDEEGV